MKDFDIFSGLAKKSSAYRIMAAAEAGDVKALRALLDRTDTLPDFANDQGLTPLMAAAMNGHASAADLLAAHPLVNLDRQDGRGYTALHHAVGSGYADVAGMLLKRCASFDIRAGESGGTAFDLATTDELKEVFRRNRRFAQKHPEKTPRTEENLIPAPPQQEAVVSASFEEAAETPFSRAAARIGIIWTIGEDKPALLLLLCTRIPGLAVDDFEDFYKLTCAATKDSGGFDWKAVFLHAAQKGADDIVEFLMDQGMTDQGMLDAALVSALDHPQVVLPLLRRGADVNAEVFSIATEKKYKIYELADFSRAWSEDLHRMTFWAESIDVKKGFHGLNSCLVGGNLKARAEFKKISAKNLRRAFNEAVRGETYGEFWRAEALYAESRRGYLLRGQVQIDDQAAGIGISRALEKDRIDLAKAMISDGYSLKNAPAELRDPERYVPEHRQFVRDHLAGKTYADRQAERKRKLALEVRQRAISAMTPIPWGGV